MRIIAGTLGGRTFDSPHGHRTHPMSDKIRGALFNMLGDIHGMSVLDAFAGSGALSFEALSRGAASAVAIDSDKSAQLTIVRNIKRLGLHGKVKCIQASANAWLQTSEARFDLVLLDPPYDDLQISLIERLVTRVEPEGLVALSWPGGQDLPQLPELVAVKHRAYGDAQLVFYRPKSA